MMLTLGGGVVVDAVARVCHDATRVVVIVALQGDISVEERAVHLLLSYTRPDVPGLAACVEALACSRRLSHTAMPACACRALRLHLVVARCGDDGHVGQQRGGVVHHLLPVVQDAV